jgi:hypothetical protein
MELLDLGLDLGLDLDLDGDGGTWLNPVDVDILMENSPWRGAMLLIVGRAVLATTGPVAEHILLLSHATQRFGRGRVTTGTDLFQREFSRAKIGMLYVSAGAAGVAVEFDVPREWPLRKYSNGVSAPAVPIERLELIIDHVREHAAMREAFPRGMQIRLHFRNYTRKVKAGGWVYENGEFREYEDEDTLCDDLCPPLR